ncbi:MAG TPA: hypothetical protein ENJ55_01660 [Rhizobiales bacterium]|nr:hypothetical protein [Hyphomicrobiales bacterium]
MNNLIKMALVLLVTVGVFPIAAQAAGKQPTGNGKFANSVVMSTRVLDDNVVAPLAQTTSIIRLAQYSGSSGRRISPSAALRAARRVAPGSQGLGVRYMPNRQAYVVTLKTRGRIRRVWVDARTGRVGR